MGPGDPFIDCDTHGNMLMPDTGRIHASGRTEGTDREGEETALIILTNAALSYMRGGPEAFGRSELRGNLGRGSLVNTDLVSVACLEFRFLVIVICLYLVPGPFSPGIPHGAANREILVIGYSCRFYHPPHPPLNTPPSPSLTPSPPLG